MVEFAPKKIAFEETVGERLRQARNYKNLKIEDVAKKINIRFDYLLALEEENFDKLPTGLYAKNFLKKYAKFLGLKPRDLLANWQEEHHYANSNNPFLQKIVKKNKFIIFPKIIKNILIVGGVSICFLYLTFYFKKIILAPELTISQPEKNLVTKSTAITIVGQTENEAEVKINGAIVLDNNNGNFQQDINLKKGLNNITVSAKKKYSRENIINRQILVQ